jgi:hypothetical protein
MPDPRQTPNDGSQPGVLGDQTEEQNLGQPGNPSARITKDEVEAAFGKDKAKDEARKGKDKHKGA